ncbi:DHHW family protein [Ruminococcus sp.]|uniref:DHHW family protein n=1 Tax=Ruminococcus sp. TaxID=41978 RepID=UPI0025EB4C81|nr:DHHW family protein [Ruminococcus sp.]
MKVKQPRRWKKQTKAQQKAAAQRVTGLLLWMILFVFGISAFICACISGQRSDSDTMLKTCSPSLQQMADSMLSHRVPGRNTLVRTVTNCIAAAGGNRVGDVYLTEERLLECPEQLDAEQLSETASLLNQFYTVYEIPTCVIAVPSAGEFYKDTLLEGMSYPSQMPEIDKFYQQISSPIRKIDVYHVLFTATEDYIYNRTDPRWSGYGAYCVYRNAIQKMGFAPIAYDQYAVIHVDSFRGSLYDACLYEKVTPDILDVYTCESGSSVTEMTAYLTDGTKEERQLYEIPTDSQADPYAFYLGQDCERLVIRTNLDNQKKLLLLKDSYADCMIPFLLQHYSEICIIDVTCMEHTLEELTEVSDHTQVLVLCDADTFAESEYFKDILTGEEKAYD